MIKKLISIAAWAVLAGGVLFSQTKKTLDPFFKDFVSRNWNAESGLPGNTITNLMQDSDGYMYFGTYTGLLRFDGVEFISMNRLYDERYDFISARTTFQDSRKNIWIGSNDEGLLCLRTDGQVLKYTVKDGLPNNSIRAISEDQNNFIWVGTASGLACINKNYVLENPSGFESIPENNHFIVNQLYCDTAGRMWIVTRTENGLYCYTGGRFEISNIIKSIENPVVTTVTQDSSGAFWFGVAPHYAIRITPETENIYNIGHGTQQGTTVTCIFQDSSKHMWFALDNGITVFHDGLLSYMDTGTILADNSVNDIMEDHEHNIWLALDRGGIQKLSYGKFQTTNMSTTVNAIAQDKFRDVVWLGCDDGLYCYKNNTFIENEITDYCRNVRIRHVEVTGSGDILVSCYEKHGQLKFNTDGSVSRWVKDEGLAGNKVRVATEMKNGELYVGTTTGLSIINEKTGQITNINKNDFLDNDYIMCLFQDTDGKVWFGTDGGGVYILNPETKEITKKITKDDGLAGNIIFKICSIRPGEIWITTGSGVSILTKETGHIFNFNLENGFGADGVFQVMLDYTQKIWGTNNKGIFNIKLSELDEVINGKRNSVTLNYFTKLDGINSGGVTSTSLSMQDDKGRLWFTLIDGFTLMNPLRNASNIYSPTVKIQTATMDSERHFIPHEPGEKGNLIKLEPNIKRLSIKYTGISHVSSEQVQFKTMLEGFDEEYSEWTGERTATYTNLKPGTYIFHVIAQNADGVQSENEATLRIVKKAFFWQTVWFRLFLFLFICGTTALFVIIRLEASRRRQEQIKQLSIEVTSALAQTIDAKDKYTNGHSNRVAEYSRMLAKRLGESEKTQESIYYSALLHDIGKIGIPNTIINKSGKLTPEEYEIIKTHPIIGSDILKSISSMPEISIGARSHHEHYDGQGYPDGLKGEDIPWIARIIGVADAYDAMTSNRSYRNYLPQERVREEFIKFRGIQFDPRVTDIIIEMIDEDKDYKMHE